MIKWLKEGFKFKIEKIKSNGVDQISVQIRLARHDRGHEVADVFIDVETLVSLEAELEVWVLLLRDAVESREIMNGSPPDPDEKFTGFGDRYK